MQRSIKAKKFKSRRDSVIALNGGKCERKTENYA